MVCGITTGRVLRILSGVREESCGLRIYSLKAVWERVEITFPRGAAGVGWAACVFLDG